MSSLDRQVGEGVYAAPYRSFAIQPAEFCHRNGLSWCAANVVKYVCRHGMKNGLEDLEKAKHYLDMLMEFEYGERSEATAKSNSTGSSSSVPTQAADWQYEEVPF